MAQASFEFSPLHDSAARPTAAPVPACQPPRHAGAAIAADAAGFDRTGFEIGWDHAHHRLTPPLRHLDDASPVRQGWAAGRAVFGARCLRATAAVRQWLALRLQAWQQGQPFEALQVNPAFLARIDTDVCPVSRQPLVLATGTAADATVARLNPQAAYAAGNLAVVAAPVADALGACGLADALARAASIASGQAAAQDGLGAAGWQRLAVLASFATPLPHAQAALLPLHLLPPNRVRVVNPVQALQVVLTLQFGTAGYARRLLGWAALMPGHEARQAFQIFMHTLLARRLAVGTAPSALALRQALEDTWSDVLVQRRWQRLATRLTAADCEQLLQRGVQRQLVVGGGHWLNAEQATEGWALPRDGAADQAPTGSAAARPGSTRNRGSQKPAS